eukprot:5642939-Prymnesium_polylepis.1
MAWEQTGLSAGPPLSRAALSRHRRDGRRGLALATIAAAAATATATASRSTSCLSTAASERGQVGPVLAIYRSTDCFQGISLAECRVKLRGQCAPTIRCGIIIRACAETRVGVRRRWRVSTQ